MIAKRPIDDWNGVRIAAGESRDVELSVSESYSGLNVKIPLHVRRGPRNGPVVFVTAALHGDELNGTGAVRALINDESFQPKAGSLILVPVVNVLGFDRHSRYLPDRRDLNRCFPGSRTGSLASRMARFIFEEIVSRADYGIDLHTAAVRRTNFPTIRADMSDEAVRRLANAFGSGLIISGAGPKGAFRRAACAAGCPTIVLEGGEVWKVEPAILDCAVRGVSNVLIELGMLDGEPQRAASQFVVEKTKWVRAERGGFLHFHVVPGEIVERNQPLATNASLLGREQNVLSAPFAGIVIGMTTIPAVSPGEPVCHLGRLAKGAKRIQRLRNKISTDDFHERLSGDLAKNLLIVDPPQED